MTNRSTRPARLVAAVTVGLGTIVFAAPAYAGPVPNPSPKLPGTLSGKLTGLLDILMALAIFACVAGVIVCAAKLALAFRHGEAGEVAGKLGGVLAACVLIGGAASLVTFVYG